MPLLNKLFGKNKKTAKPKKTEVKENKVKTQAKPIETKAPKTATVLKSEILVSPHMAEKALMDQNIGKYVFKVAPSANKVKISKEINKIYGVKVVGVNIINTKSKERKVGKTIGVKPGYKKAIVTLAKGQTIEIK